jgi:hypothetical protein
MDTGLLFTSSAKDYLQQHPIGCGSKVFRGNKGRQKWAKKAQRDPRIKRLINEILDCDSIALLIGRVSGAFIPWDRFKAFGVICDHYFNNRFFEQNPTQHWPLTEIAIPTILCLLEGTDAKLQPVIIQSPATKKITTNSIKKAAKLRLFRIKKVARDTNGEAF